MSQDNRKFAFKPCLLVFKSQIVAACNEAKVSLEDWEIRHIAILQAEFGKLGISAARAGLVSLGKDCEDAREGVTNKYKPGGKSAHPSLRFYREACQATAYKEEFGTAHIGMTDSAAAYVKDVAARLANKAPVTTEATPVAA